MRYVAVLILFIVLCPPAFGADTASDRRELEIDIQMTCAEVMNARYNLQLAIDDYGNNMMDPDVHPHWRIVQLRKERLMLLSDRYKRRYGVWPDVCLGLKSELERDERQRAGDHTPH